jgi:hypothetical protein
MRYALEIFQRIGAAEVAEVAAELEVLTDARPTGKDHDFRRRPGPDLGGPEERTHQLRREWRQQ